MNEKIEMCKNCLIRLTELSRYASVDGFGCYDKKCKGYCKELKQNCINPYCQHHHKESKEKEIIVILDYE